MLIGCFLEEPGNQSAMYARRQCHEQVRGVWKLAWRIRVTRSTHLGEVIATRMPEDQAGVRVVRRHNLLVRCSPLAERANPSRPHPEWRGLKPVHIGDMNVWVIKSVAIEGGRASHRDYGRGLRPEKQDLHEPRA